MALHEISNLFNSSAVSTLILWFISFFFPSKKKKQEAKILEIIRLESAWL